MLVKNFDEKFNEVHKKLDDNNGQIQKKLDDNNQFQNDKLVQIDKKVTETNGKTADINAWRERVKGGAWVFGVVATLVIVPLFTWAFVTISMIDRKINAGIEAALSEYEIFVK